MNVLGIEGGGTHTSALLVNCADDTVLKTVSAGPGNFRLLSNDALAALLGEIRNELPAEPDRIGIGLAGVRSEADRERLTGTLARLWPGVPTAVSDDLLLALESAEWRDDCAAQVLLLSGTGSCCLGRRRDGTMVKVGGRGHIIGDRGSSCDIAMHALRSIMTISDIRSDWPRLGADILGFLQMNDPESLIEWSMTASKTELASLARVVFEAAATRQDEIAVPILKRMAYRLSKDAVQCAARIATEGEKVQFVMNGAVLLKNPAFATGVMEKIRAAWPRSEIAPPDRPSVWGAVEMARKLCDDSKKPPSVRQPDVAAGLDRDLVNWRPVSDSPTESGNPRSSRLPELPLSDAIRLMLSEDETIPAKILKESAGIEWAIREVVRAFSEGGRLIYCGAGTSGRLAVLDASECPPTFRTPANLVQGIIAGGRAALGSAVEGAEDDLAGGVQAIAFRQVDAKDVVVGISASGHAPFVWGCLGEARRRGATTVLICCNPAYRDHPLVDRAILPDTGPEILSGSTRLKAGTATKLILNLISTLAMTHSGKVIGNVMIDLNPSNTKLRNRAIRIVQKLTGVDEATAHSTLEHNGWIVREACKTLTPPAAVAKKNSDTGLHPS